LQLLHINNLLFCFLVSFSAVYHWTYKPMPYVLDFWGSSTYFKVSSTEEVYSSLRNSATLVLLPTGQLSSTCDSRSHAPPVLRFWQMLGPRVAIYSSW
jgi:hypothetical protein